MVKWLKLLTVYSPLPRLPRTTVCIPVSTLEGSIALGQLERGALLQ